MTVMHIAIPDELKDALLGFTRSATHACRREYVHFR